MGQKKLTLEEKKQRRRALDELGVPSFWDFIVNSDAKPLDRQPTSVLQLNIGLYCNQACNHCHVESSPKRQEAMDEATALQCIKVNAVKYIWPRARGYL